MPRYLHLHRTGQLAGRAAMALERLSPCSLCPRQCGVDRLGDERGLCLVGRNALVASYHLHFGEESPLSGTGGSGTIFFAGCNLGCVFCQNYDISHATDGAIETGPQQLAGIMLELQQQGAHNINVVTPTHVTAQILAALPLAADMGLRIPLVWNTSSYERTETLDLLDGVVDVFLPDIKFWDEQHARGYAHAPDYPECARRALEIMHRQVGDLVLDADGLATQGLLVRHLVMPDDIAGTREWMHFLAEKISRQTWVNLMDQYRPCGQASLFPEIARTIRPEEYARAREMAEAADITRLDDRNDRLAFHLVRALLPR